jgi:hypothetical protein
MPRPDVKVRLAQDSEGEIVAGLFDDIFHMGDWHPSFEKVFPHWLVAEIAGEIVGTINVRISLPISSIEMLAMEPGLSHVEKSTVTIMLLDTALCICGAAGAEGVSSMIPDGLDSYLEVVKDHGYEIGSEGVIVFGRIR